VTFYPHGALREPIDAPPQSDDPDDELVIVGRFSKLVPRNISEIYETDPLRFDNADRATSEGFAPLELADYCTTVSFSQSLAGVFGGANITLELPFADALKLLGGVVAGKARHLRRDNAALTLRNLCTGGWLVIKQATVKGDLVGRFFGQVTRIENRLMYGADGKPVRVINLTADSFYAGFMRNQLKQTMTRDDNLREIEPSAVFKAADYSDAFLKTIKDSFRGQAPAATLAEVIKALGGHKLPSSLARFDDAPLGLFIKVCDGSFAEMQKYGLKGADVDVIKGKIMSLFQGAASNNVTHHEVIMQMFNALPQLFEYFALFIPLTPRELAQVSKSRLFAQLGGVPVIIYRYKPVYPYAPPSRAGLSALTRFKYGIDSKVKTETDCEKFFGDMPAVSAGEGQSYQIDSRYLTALEYGVSEDDRVNFTFVEGAFSNAQGHALNYFRNNASPALNKGDINRHGLRARSMHTPFVSLDSDTAEIKAFNMGAPNALAERLFHNIAMGHTFTSGTFTVEHDVAARHLLNTREALSCVPVGNWVSFSLDISETDDVLFTCYIEAVTTNISADAVGVITSVSTYNFTRGHIGVHAPEFDVSKYEAEEMALLISNEDVSNA
jgi:hypothetical protein